MCGAPSRAPDTSLAHERKSLEDVLGVVVRHNVRDERLQRVGAVFLAVGDRWAELPGESAKVRLGNEAWGNEPEVVYR